MNRTPHVEDHKFDHKFIPFGNYFVMLEKGGLSWRRK